MIATRSERRLGRRWTIAAWPLAMALTMAACSEAVPGHPAGAEAASRLDTGTGGSELAHRNLTVRERWLGKADQAGARFARLEVPWASIAAVKPANPRDPADPAYGFAALDQSVISVTQSGLVPVFTVNGAPGWARSDKCGKAVAPTGCKPKPAAFGAFGAALARRYSGSFGGLPRVRHLQAWNEPNLSSNLGPQWSGKRKPLSPARYRKMLNAFTDGVRSVDRTNVVITAGAAPFGEPRGGTRMRPVAFWRGVFCLNRKLKRNCSAKVRFDALAYHAINLRGGAQRSAIHRDDAAVPNLDRVRRVVRAAERRGSAPGGRHPLWVTEMWWESNPPDKKFGLKPAKQAARIAQTLFEVWKDGARVAINLLVRDEAYRRKNPGASLQAGLYFRNGKAKPAARAFRFPFVVRSRSKKRGLRVWGRAPAGGKLEIQRRTKRGWRTIKRVRVKPRAVFQSRVRAPRGAKLRAKLGSAKSLTG